MRRLAGRPSAICEGWRRPQRDLGRGAHGAGSNHSFGGTMPMEQRSRCWEGERREGSPERAIRQPFTGSLGHAEEDQGLLLRGAVGGPQSG